MLKMLRKHYSNYYEVTSMAKLQLFVLDILYFLILESWFYMQLLKLLAF